MAEYHFGMVINGNQSQIKPNLPKIKIRQEKEQNDVYQSEFKLNI